MHSVKTQGLVCLSGCGAQRLVCIYGFYIYICIKAILCVYGCVQVKRGGLVLDPFVGTGSILIACARFGAFCMGTDIDIRILRYLYQHSLPSHETSAEQNALDTLRFDLEGAVDSLGLF